MMYRSLSNRFGGTLSAYNRKNCMDAKTDSELHPGECAEGWQGVQRSAQQPTFFLTAGSELCRPQQKVRSTRLNNSFPNC